jgi:hypothetical protein
MLVVCSENLLPTQKLFLILAFCISGRCRVLVAVCDQLDGSPSTSRKVLFITFSIAEPSDFNGQRNGCPYPRCAKSRQIARRYWKRLARRSGPTISLVLWQDFVLHSQVTHDYYVSAPRGWRPKPAGIAIRAPVGVMGMPTHRQPVCLTVFTKHDYRDVDANRRLDDIAAKCESG